ncbi:GNAT family N-acetyltransferase [Cribrihabitans pelagius]|uniref:GNAT family N-acetyltransferase n=1 Tax=Cribrihabitans pelagius TaxID=1765746 RepID=UPI003B5A5C30
MKIIDVPPAEAPRLLPLLKELHALHVAHQPARHVADPEDGALAAWLQDWLSSADAFALAAEDPQGALLGYLIFTLEVRPALPVRAAETRVMLQHIAVAEAHRRQGVARALMAEMKARAAARGVTVIATTYAPFNTASAALMQRMGLEPVLTVAEMRAG